jgi:hypothetical protein
VAQRIREKVSVRSRRPGTTWRQSRSRPRLELSLRQTK